MKIAVQTAIVFAFLFARSYADSAIDCTVRGYGKSFTVTVNMTMPHPGEMLVRTPDGREIWLQADHIPFQFPVSGNFAKMTRFVMDERTAGTWFNDWGEPEAVPILSVDGNYELIVASDIENRRGDSTTLSCRFSVGDDEAGNQD